MSTPGRGVGLHKDPVRDSVTRVAEALERLAKSNEDIVDLAKGESGLNVIEVEPGPPFCPHCGVVNPSITQMVSPSGASNGKFGEFVLIAHCGNCNERFFGLPQGWEVAKSVDELQEIQEGRNNVN